MKQIQMLKVLVLASRPAAGSPRVGRAIKSAERKIRVTLDGYQKRRKKLNHELATLARSNKDFFIRSGRCIGCGYSSDFCICPKAESRQLELITIGQ